MVLYFEGVTKGRWRRRIRLRYDNGDKVQSPCMVGVRYAAMVVFIRRIRCVSPIRPSGAPANARRVRSEGGTTP